MQLAPSSSRLRPAQQRVALPVAAGHRSLAAARCAVRAQAEAVSCIPTFTKEQLKSYKQISVDELATKLRSGAKDFIVMDVREPSVSFDSSGYPPEAARW